MVEMYANLILLFQSRVHVWGDVDIVATIIKFFRAKLPELLELCSRELQKDNLDPKVFYDAFLTLFKELGALILRASNRNVDAVE